MMARMTKSPKASKRIRSGKKLSRSTRKAALRKAMLENDKKTKSKEDGKEKKKAKPQEAKQSNFEKEVREKVDKALRMAREGMEAGRCEGSRGERNGDGGGDCGGEGVQVPEADRYASDRQGG